jgi:hypothetical protein
MPEPSPLDALWSDIQALTIALALAAWRIERDLAALEEPDDPGLIRLPDPTAAPGLPDRLRLYCFQRSAP